MTNNKINLPTFTISLDASVERRLHVNKLCKKYGLSTEIIKAVDGKLLGDSFIESLYSKDKAIQSIGRELSKSEIGCALSHKKIYQKIVDEKIKVALIFEDDIDFNGDLIDVLSMLDKLPTNWELVLLGHHTSRSRSIDTLASLWGGLNYIPKYKIVRPCEVGYGAYGYLIKLRGAEKLLTDLNEIVKPIDHYTGDSTQVNNYIISPPVIRISDYFSEMHNTMAGRKELDDAYRSSMQAKPISWYKKIALFLGIFELLFFTRKNLMSVYKRVKPLRVYK